MHNFFNVFENDKKALDLIIEEITKRQAKEPAGTLKTCRKKGRTEYYQRLPCQNEKAVYIKKGNMSFAMALAQKDYDKKVLTILTALRKAIDNFEHSLPDKTIESVYNELGPEKKALVTPVIPTLRQRIKNWLDMPYTAPGFRTDDTTEFYTQKGERVRSKSEVIIADILYYFDIPYKYECPLTIDGQTIYPDFTILDIKHNRTVYLEHCGMMDDPAYLNRFINKMMLYQINGLEHGKSLFVTYESSQKPLNTQDVKNLITGNLL